MFCLGYEKEELKRQIAITEFVVVRKKNGKPIVCIDFMDLNKACPKDSFPLPMIDTLVDATAYHELMSFLDAILYTIKSSCTQKIQKKKLFYDLERNLLL